MKSSLKKLWQKLKMVRALFSFKSRNYVLIIVDRPNRITDDCAMFYQYSLAFTDYDGELMKDAIETAAKQLQDKIEPDRQKAIENEIHKILKR